MRKVIYSLVAAGVLLLAAQAFADTLAQFNAEPPDFPVKNSDVPGLTPASPEIRPDDRLLFTGGAPPTADDDCFGFGPQIDSVPGSSDFIAVTWCEKGGWSNPGKAGLWRYKPDGTLVAGPADVQDAGEDPFGHGFAWDLGTFSDGTSVAAGTAKGGIVGLETLNFEVCGTRFFDVNLNRVGPLVSTFEPTLIWGNDARDGVVGGDLFLRARIAVIAASGASGERFVVTAAMNSAAAQTANGLVDPAHPCEAANKAGCPGTKTYFRVFNKDGTPVTSTKLAFRYLGDDAAKWAGTEGRHDVAARAGGKGFVMVTGCCVERASNNGPTPVYFYDRDGNFERIVGVEDADLIANSAAAVSIIESDISQANGIYALQSTVLTTFSFPPNPPAAGRTLAITLFDDAGNILRSTFDGSQTHNLSPIRESETMQDPFGNVYTATRGQYVDIREPSPFPPLGPDSSNDMLLGRAITNKGAHWTPNFAVPDPLYYGGSQRDPGIAANRDYVAFHYLSDARTDPDTGEIIVPQNTKGGVNTIRIFNSPFTMQKPGDCNQDGATDLSDAVCLLGHLFQATPATLPCGDGTVNAPGNKALLDCNGDNGIDLSDAIWLLTFLFQGGAPPVGGTDVTPIAGCPDNTAKI